MLSLCLSYIICHSHSLFLFEFIVLYREEYVSVFVKCCCHRAVIVSHLNNFWIRHTGIPCRTVLLCTTTLYSFDGISVYRVTNHCKRTWVGVATSGRKMQRKMQFRGSWLIYLKMQFRESIKNFHLKRCTVMRLF